MKAVIGALEAGAIQPTEKQLEMLCGIYHIQAAWLSAQPLVFESVQQAFAAEKMGVITDDQLMQFIVIDWGLNPTPELSNK